MSAKRSVTKTILFSLIPLLALIILLELGLRALYFQRNNQHTFAIGALVEKIQNRNKTGDIPPRHVRLKELQPLMDIKIRPQKDYLAHSDNLQDKEYRFRTDENGFIIPMNRSEDPEFSIVFLGGSTTECSYVSEESRFPFQVGLLLNRETNRKINVYNSGVSGNHTYHAIDLLINKIVPMQPRYAVLMECINDWTTLLFEGTYWNKNPTRSLIIDPNMKAPISDDEWQAIRGKQLKVDMEHIVGEYARAQQTFISICRANNIEPVLMTQANRYLEVPDEKILKSANESLNSFGLSYKDAMAINVAMNASIRTTAMQNNVKLIDLDKLVPKSGALMYDIVHYNDKGSIMAGEIIGKQLLEIIH